MVLFDSDIRHQHVISIKICEAYRKRDLHRDWIGAGKLITELTMSEAQWASFVSSMNSGSGVPVTLDFRESTATGGDPHVPSFPYEPRLQQSMDEVREAAQRAVEDVRRSFQEYKAKPTKDHLRHLEAMIDNMAPNIAFAASSLTEHAENVVQRAKADIEAFVVNKAQQLGLNPSDLENPPQLTAGDES